MEASNKSISEVMEVVERIVIEQRDRITNPNTVLISVELKSGVTYTVLSSSRIASTVYQSGLTFGKIIGHSLDTIVTSLLGIEEEEKSE